MILIELANGQFYFELFYAVAILVASVIFLSSNITGINKFKDRLVILIFILLFLMAGAKIFTYSPSDWKYMISTGEILPAPGLTILGAISGSLFAIFLIKRIMNIQVNIADRFALILPIGMTIQRIGCFMVGCCFGSPSELPWSVSYGSSHIAYHMHQNNGWIDHDATHSLSVHPNQLYQIVFCIISAFIIYRCRNKFERSGSLLLFSVLLYLASRFFTEFTRDDSSNGYAGMDIAGLKIVQWIVLFSVVITGLLIYFREKNLTGYSIGEYKLKNRYSVMLFIACMFLYLKNWFSLFEFALLEIFIMVLFFIEMKELFEKLKTKYNLNIGLQYALGVKMLLAGCILVAQNTDDYFKIKKYHDIYYGFGIASYNYYHLTPTGTYYPGWGCNPGYTHYSPNGDNYKNSLNAYGFGYRFRKEKSKYESIEVNVNGTMGKLTSNNPDRTFSYSYAGSVNFRSEHKLIGFGLGFGFLKIPNANVKHVYWYNENNKMYENGYVDYYLRFLRRDRASIIIRNTSVFPMTEIQMNNRDFLPMEFLISSSFYPNSMINFEAGINSDARAFLGIQFPILKNYILGTKFYFPTQYLHNSAAHFTFGYRMGN